VERGLSLTALSERVHYSKGYLSKVETGDRPATAELARRCDEVLDAKGTLASLVPDQPSRRGGLPRPAQLPAAVPDFTGRHAALARLDAAIKTHAAVIVTGAPGVGKTAVALHWAHHAAGWFPDGCLFANMRGYDPAGPPAEPAEVLEGFLRAVGTAPGAIPADSESRAALLRTLLHGRQMLIVLDNAAAPEQVRPLLPGPGDCRVVVTSRGQLSGLAARDGAARLRIEPMPPPEAVALLRRILGPERIAAEPSAADAITAQCGYLPLALRIAAERAQGRPALRLALLATQLAASTDRLDLLATADDASAAVRAAFSWSYRILPPGIARMFRLLGLYRGHDVSIPAAAALAGISPPQARRVLEALAGVNLLEESGPDRYCFHDLIRLYATECAASEETADSQAAATRRLCTWYLHTADADAQILAPQRPRPVLGPAQDCQPLTFDDYAQALDWYDSECANLAAVARQATDADLHTLAWQIPAVAWSYFNLRKPWTDWISAQQAGLDGARLGGDKHGEAWMLTGLSAAYVDLGRYQEALDCCERGLAIRRQLGDSDGECSCLRNMGIICRHLNQAHDAIAWSSRALALGRTIGNTDVVAAALASLGEAYLEIDRPEDALGYFRESLAACVETSDRYGEAHVLDGMGRANRALGHSGQAIDLLEQSLLARHEVGDRHGETTTLLHLGELYSDTGQPRASRQAWREALAICEDLGDPRAAELRDLLSLTNGTGPQPADQHEVKPLHT
jgi:tetratricopeptide (TPR) repeat protein